MITAGSSAETYNTIVSFSESPLSPRILWAGTDDGNVQVTRDGGATWTNVGRNLKGLPGANLYVARIEASHFDSATAYIAIDGHRSDVFQPLVFVTSDFGKTWRPIAGTLPTGGPVKAFREDPANPDLLFAGTEFALWFSLDRGTSWNRFRNGLPTVAFDDIQIHPRDRDLIVGTHGRSIYILDDILALEQLTPAVRDSAAWLFSVRPAQPFWKAQESGSNHRCIENHRTSVLRICSVAEANKPNYQGQCKGTHSRLPDLFHPKSSLILWWLVKKRGAL